MLDGGAMRLFACVMVLATGCVTAEPEELGRNAGELDGGAIAYLAGGQWSRVVGCPSPDPSTCLHEANFWVDLRIRNDAYDKRVGIVWFDEVRDDESAPWHVSIGRFESPLEDGFERWGLDVTAGVYGDLEPSPRIRFAAFVEMAGTTSWDNNGGADHLLP